ncbi:hypothetical protein J3F84DRAFT_341171 [Trichoderma pleuroticola]
MLFVRTKGRYHAQARLVHASVVCVCVCVCHPIIASLTHAPRVSLFSLCVCVCFFLLLGAPPPPLDLTWPGTSGSLAGAIPGSE